MQTSASGPPLWTTVPGQPPWSQHLWTQPQDLPQYQGAPKAPVSQLSSALGQPQWTQFLGQFSWLQAHILLQCQAILVDHVSTFAPVALSSRVVPVVPKFQPKNSAHPSTGAFGLHFSTHIPKVPSLQHQAPVLPQYQVSTRRPRCQSGSHKPGYQSA